KDECVRLLCYLCERFDRAASDADIGEDRRGGKVVIPKAVMQRLEVPHTLAGLRVKTHDGFGKQVVAGTRAAKVNARCFFEWKIDVAELVVTTQKRPRAAVTGVEIRSVEPRVFSVLAGPRHDMKCPEEFAGARIETADIVRRRFLCGLHALIEVIGGGRGNAR